MQFGKENVFTRNTETMNKHNNSYTISKAIGIILVVIGHAVCPELLSKTIYLFHMPLFFFCSGCYCKIPTTPKEYLSFISKQIKRLYWPFVKWGIIFLLVHNILLSIHIYSHIETSTYTTEEILRRLRLILFSMTGQDPLIYQLWFLKQLFIASIMVCSLKFFISIRSLKENMPLCLSLLMTITVITKYFHLFIPILGDVSLAFLSSSFFYLGSIHKLIHTTVKFNQKHIYICVIILISIAWLYGPKIEMLNYSYKNVTILYVSSLLGIIMIREISKSLSKTKSRFLLYYIGNHTMVIFIWHLIAFKIGSLIKIAIFNYPTNRLPEYDLIAENNDTFWIVYSFIGCFIPLSFQYIFSRIAYHPRQIKNIHHIIITKIKKHIHDFY